MQNFLWEIVDDLTVFVLLSLILGERCWVTGELIRNSELGGEDQIVLSKLVSECKFICNLN